MFAVYYAKWMQFDPTLEYSARVFATFPAVPGFWPGFIDQVVGTALLMALILAIGDQNNNGAGSTWTALAVAAAGVRLVGLALGGPVGRLQSSAAGWPDAW